MNRCRIGCCIFAGILIVACSDSPTTRGWTEGSLMAQPLTDGEVVDRGASHRLVVGTDPSETGETPARCLQFVVGDTGLGCIATDPAPGNVYGHGATVDVDGARAIWRAGTIDEPDRPIDHYVVWSSESPDGRRFDPIVFETVTNLVWIMLPGEAPWGIQTIATDGSLLEAESLVGLPGD